MFVKDNFIHTTIATEMQIKKRISVLKSLVVQYEEVSPKVTKIIVNMRVPEYIKINTPYEDVKVALQETVA